MPEANDIQGGSKEGGSRGRAGVKIHFFFFFKYEAKCGRAQGKKVVCM
jgi:hypothetical protein